MKTLITGSVAFDYLMTFPGYFKDFILPDKLETISLSFLVDSMVQQKGGVAPNIAYAMALLGEKPMIWGGVGNDFTEYRNWLEMIGVDTTYAKVFPEVKTASFFVNTDLNGNQIASFYPGAMAHSEEMSLKELNFKPDIVIIAPNQPEAMVKLVRECYELKIPYVFDPSQQIVRLSRENLIDGIEHALILFVNEYEAALIQKVAGLTPDNISRRKDAPEGAFVVVTKGADGADIFTYDEIFHIHAIPPTGNICPTGVGDAFRGGFFTGLANHFDLVTCGRMGALIASYCLEKSGSQEYSFSLNEYKNRFSTIYGDRLEF